MPDRVYSHPDEKVITIIQDLDKLVALKHDSNRKVVPWAKMLEIAAYSQRHHPRAYLFQQFNCAGCGARQTMPYPDTLFIEGHCEECGTVTDLRKDGAWLIGLELPPAAEALFLQMMAKIAAQPDHVDTRKP